MQAIIKLPEVCRRVGLTRSPIYAGIKAGTFPRPVKLGIRAVGWLESEVDAWLSARAAARPEVAK